MGNDIIEIAKNLTELKSSKKGIYIEQIPKSLRTDFMTHMIGKTHTLIENRPYFHYHDYLDWYNKVVYTTGITS